MVSKQLCRPILLPIGERLGEDVLIIGRGRRPADIIVRGHAVGAMPWVRVAAFAAKTDARKSFEMSPRRFVSGGCDNLVKLWRYDDSQSRWVEEAKLEAAKTKEKAELDKTKAEEEKKNAEKQNEADKKAADAENEAKKKEGDAAAKVAEGKNAAAAVQLNAAAPTTVATGAQNPPADKPADKPAAQTPAAGGK